MILRHMSLCLLLKAAHLRFLGVFYPDKVRKELEDLNFKIEKLNNFIEKNDIFKTIDLEEQELLKEQREIMTKYANILRKRIK